MFWLVQVLGCFVILFTILSFLQKEKWKMFLLFALTNLFLIPIYILSGSLLGGILVTGALVKTICFSIYNKANKKPDITFLSLFISFYILISIILWSNNVDLLMLINLLILTFTSWQNDINLIRAGYIISSILLFAYDIILGAYTTAISELIMFITTIILIIANKKIEKSFRNIAQEWYKLNESLWGIKVINKGEYDVIESSVDKSPYYNVCIINDFSNIQNTLLEIKKDCRERKARELVYINFQPRIHNANLSESCKFDMLFKKVFGDCWMKLIDGFNLNNTKCLIQGVTFKEVGNENKEEIIEVFIKGYLEKNAEDLLPAEEKIIENLRSQDFSKKINEKRIRVYLAYFNEQPVSVVFSLADGKEIFFGKIATLPIFRRKHIASALIQYAIAKERNRGQYDFYIVTDKGSTNEKFYTFNNFSEFARGYCYDIQDFKRYEKFIETGKIEG